MYRAIYNQNVHGSHETSTATNTPRHVAPSWRAVPEGHHATTTPTTSSADRTVTLQACTWLWLFAACGVAVVVVCGTTWGIQQAYFDKTCERDATEAAKSDDSEAMNAFVRGLRDAATATEDDAPPESEESDFVTIDGAYSEGYAFGFQSVERATNETSGRRSLFSPYADTKLRCGVPYTERVLEWKCKTLGFRIKWKSCKFEYTKKTITFPCTPTPIPTPTPTPDNSLWWKTQLHYKITSAERFVWENSNRGW